MATGYPDEGRQCKSGEQVAEFGEVVHFSAMLPLVSSCSVSLNFLVTLRILNQGQGGPQHSQENTSPFHYWLSIFLLL